MLELFADLFALVVGGLCHPALYKEFPLASCPCLKLLY